MKTVVSFGSLPGVVYQSRLPDARGRGRDYTVMRFGSDDAVFLAAPVKVEVEVEHPEDMPHHQVVAKAYRELQRMIAEEVWEEFRACWQRRVDEARGDVSL